MSACMKVFGRVRDMLYFDFMTPFGSFRKIGVPYSRVLIQRILRLRVLYQGPLFSATSIYQAHQLISSFHSASDRLLVRYRRS